MIYIISITDLILVIVVGKGKRLIIPHAGSERGFIPEAIFIVRTDGRADYHSFMNW